MIDGELKTVARFREPLGARILAGMLNENGIPAAVFGENSSYTSLNYIDEIEVKVNEDDYDEAMKLIHAVQSANLEEDTEE